MQVSDPYREDLRAIYHARVLESFTSARTLLRRARRARQSGDYINRRRWLNHVHILWMAGAEWRERAKGVAP
jgi:hypothetical protein